jgi:putative polyhydroxyalkanoate system protein
MPSIHLSTPHNLGAATARQRVEEVATQIKNRFGVTYNWSGNDLRFNRSGINGTISVEDKAVTVDAEIGMMLTPFKGEIEKQLRQFMEEKLQ